MHTILKVTILILVDGFLQFRIPISTRIHRQVTILILVDGFLQYHVRYLNHIIQSQSLF